MEKFVAQRSGNPVFRAGMINPKNRCSFPFDRATLPAKKEAAVRPLNCRVKTPSNQPNNENNRFNPYFL
jgi:hypothetical protein